MVYLSNPSSYDAVLNRHILKMTVYESYGECQPVLKFVSIFSNILGDGRKFYWICQLMLAFGETLAVKLLE